MPRGPKGKRVVAGDGYSVAGKNSNGVGSVYFEPPSTRADGTVVKGRWRATYVDLDVKIKRVTAPTRALAESRWDELVTALGRRRSTARFSITTTVQELSDWWRESVARHQARESSLRLTESRSHTSSTSSATCASSTSDRRCSRRGSRRCWIGSLRTSS